MLRERSGGQQWPASMRASERTGDYQALSGERCPATSLCYHVCRLLGRLCLGIVYYAGWSTTQLKVIFFCSRRMSLLEQSKNWIRPEDLDARIEEALDNPVPLNK